MAIPKNLISSSFARKFLGLFRRTRYHENLESVFFYTLHKCASTLFSHYLLEHVEGLRHVDYENEYFSGLRTVKAEFSDKGYIYGPIRVSVRAMEPTFSLFTKPVSSPDFVEGKKAIFMARDPRDMLVSSYYSYAYSHPSSPLEEIRDEQERIRKRILSKTVDEFVLGMAPHVHRDYQLLITLTQVCKRRVVLQYEDMVENFNDFVRDLTRYLTLRDDVIQELYSQSRPREKEDITAHRRSGRVGGFRDKLSSETIQSLNETFRDVMNEFGYAP